MHLLRSFMLFKFFRVFQCPGLIFLIVCLSVFCVAPQGYPIDLINNIYYYINLHILYYIFKVTYDFIRLLLRVLRVLKGFKCFRGYPDLITIWAYVVSTPLRPYLCDLISRLTLQAQTIKNTINSHGQP